jgi:serine/threonine protein kinase
VANLLVDGNGHLKLADFGLAREETAEGQYTPRVVTLWYRAPELLLGSRTYGRGVDVWSFACCLYELALVRPLFPGHSEAEVLVLIARLLGPPPPSDQPPIPSSPAPLVPGEEKEARLAGLSPPLRSLFCRLLLYDPLRRPSFDQIVRLILKHYTSACAPVAGRSENVR